MAQCRRVLLWVVITTTVLTVVECTCHEQGSGNGPAPMITSVVANRVPNGKVSEISIEWGDDTQNPNWQYVERYIFFFGFETNGRMCKSAGTLSKDIADVMNDSGAFSATLQHTLDPFVKYTVQVAQDWTGDGFGRKSQAFGFTLNATLTFDEPEEDSVLIHWPMRTTKNISAFVWQYSTEGLEEFVHQRNGTPLLGSHASDLLEDLEEGARYRISVQASNSNPTVEMKALTTIVKTKATKPAKPQNLTGMGVGSEIALAWRPPPPRDRNGDITAYEIKWTIPSTLSEVLDVMVKANETHRAEWNYTIPAVQRGGTYKVAVAAINEAGTGEYATIEVLTPPPPSTDTTPTPAPTPTHGSGNTTSSVADDTTKWNDSVLLFIAIPVGITIVILSTVIVVTVCILIKVKRTATKAARSLAIAQSQLTQQEANNYTTTHIYEDPEAVMAEYQSISMSDKKIEATNHTCLPFDKETFLPTTDDRFGAGYAILEANGYHGDTSRPSISDSEVSSLCESFLQSTCPADYEKPQSTSTAAQTQSDPTCTHSQSEEATVEASGYTDLLSSTLNARDYETPVFQNGNAACAAPA